MRVPDEPRICRACYPPHVENCPDCFGWGFDGEGVIVNGSRVMEVRQSGGWKECETCGGSPEGVPE